MIKKRWRWKINTEAKRREILCPPYGKKQAHEQASISRVISQNSPILWKPKTWSNPPSKIRKDSDSPGSPNSIFNMSPGVAGAGYASVGFCTPPDAKPKVSNRARIECWSQEKEDRCDRERERIWNTETDTMTLLFQELGWRGSGMHRIKPFETLWRLRDAGNMPDGEKGRRINIDEDARWMNKQKLLRPGRKAECGPERGACRGPWGTPTRGGR
jgi:hypothetical protein